MRILAHCLLSAFLACATTPALAELFVVNSSADPGDGACSASHCTLREALQAANSSQDFSSTVRFAIPGNGPHTIALTMPLPTLTSNVTIDGLSQPGATAANLNTGHGFRPAIVLDGAQIPDTGPVHGLRVVPVRFVGPTIKGLAWVNFRRPAGDGAAIWLDGTALDANEVIVENNFIGLLPAGTAAGNDAGVRVTNAADVSIVSNVISANTVGVLGNGRGHLRGAGVTNNRIGTNPAGTAALPNTQDGIRMVSACASPAQTFQITDNIIAGNTRDGIQLVGASGTCNLLVGGASSIVGNRIGINASGTALGNGGHGVSMGLLATSKSLRIGSPVSSSFSEDRNRIGHNAGAGVAVLNGAGGAVIRENTFIRNTGLAIDLGDNGASPNDPGDPDTGANRLLNFPELGLKRFENFATQLTYRLSSDAAHVTYPIRVDFYVLANNQLTFLDTDLYSTPGVNRTVTLDAGENAVIVAMASDGGDADSGAGLSNSSEFSPAARSVLFANGFE